MNNPKYEDQYDDNNSICPYCGNKYQVEAEDFSEDPYEIECDECGKKYWLVQQISISHKTTPDCELNGQSHKFAAQVCGYFCWVCGKYQAKR